MNENCNQANLVNTLFYPYRVEKIDFNKRYMVAGLFNQYRILFGEPSNELLALKFIGERLYNSESAIFIALTNCQDSIPVGFVQLHFKYSSIKAIKSAILDDLFVLPEYRNKGIALKLIQAGIKFAIRNKSSDIQLEILKENLSAQKIYESVGFKKQKQISEVHGYFIKLKDD